MTRGANATKAENRERAMAEREAPLRRRIETLEREVERLDRANAQQRAAHLEETRKMRGLIDAQTSEALTEAGERIVALTQDRDKIAVALADIYKTWNKAAKGMLGLLHSQGVSHEDATQMLLEWVGEEPDMPLYVADGEEAAAKLGADGVRALRRARRTRNAAPPVT